MLSKVKGSPQKGFTLIELMIVIAIIGILAAIAIPNFIDYRNKSFCSRTESDANNIAAGLSDYFSIPNHTLLPVLGTGTANLRVIMSGANTGSIGGTAASITITVTDGSGRCPTTYRNSMQSVASSFRDGWTLAAPGVYTKYMNN